MPLADLHPARCHAHAPPHLPFGGMLGLAARMASTDKPVFTDTRPSVRPRVTRNWQPWVSAMGGCPACSAAGSPSVAAAGTVPCSAAGTSANTGGTAAGSPADTGGLPVAFSGTGGASSGAGTLSIAGGSGGGRASSGVGGGCTAATVGGRPGAAPSGVGGAAAGWAQASMAGASCASSGLLTSAVGRPAAARPPGCPCSHNIARCRGEVSHAEGWHRKWFSPAPAKLSVQREALGGLEAPWCAP